MAARLDLEARLRALREPKAPLTPSTAPSVPPPSPVLFPTAMSPPVAPPIAPPPPVAILPPPPPPDPTPTSTPPKRMSFSRPRPNFAALSTPASPPPPVVISRQSTQLEKNPSDRLVPSPPPIDMVKVLGPAYEAAVAQAQYAIECERKRLVHTAIDGYIASGQALVALGRQQTVPHLQNILRTKALALLQRAEGLEEWAARVIAELHATESAAIASGATVATRDKEETLRAAIAQSQEKEEQALKQKEELVAQMKSQNSEMTKKLNQLVLLTKVRARFRRVISERRARKAEEQRLRGESGDHDDENEHDVDAARSEVIADEEYREEDDAHREPAAVPTKKAHVSLPTSLSSSPREEQKRALVNELHQLIGLPQVDHLRHFKPLAVTADTDRRQEDLARELEEARLEAERLRNAVQDMEDTLRAAAEESREHSIKLEKEKEDEVAQLQAELARMKSALEMERRLSSKRTSLILDSDDDDEDDDENDARARDPDAFEDSAMMSQLRDSLRGMSHEDTRSPHERRRSSGRTRRVARNSTEQTSPRHRTERMGSWGFDRDDEKHEEGDSEDGLWV